MNKIVIIGGGPAGLSSAIYAARADLEPVVIAPAGGQIVLSSEVGNYPGFPEPVTGLQLIGDMTEQAEKYGAKFIKKNVSRVDFSNLPFKIWTQEDEMVEAQAVIVATGASARWLGVPGEGQLRGKGVSACATCDGFFFRDKEVAVIGGGDVAIEDALFLTKFAKKVTVIHRRDELRASKILEKRAKENEKIEFLWNTEVKEFLGSDKLEVIKVVNNLTKEESEMKIDGAFVAIGHTPNTKFLGEQLALLESGYIKVKDFTKSSVEGVFVAGDVADAKYRQASVAAGFGVMAEIDAERWLEGGQQSFTD